MEREFVGYEEALALKELGFNELCFGYFHYIYKKDLIVYPIKGCVNSALLEKEVSAPLFQQAFRFFREKYQIECYIKSLYEQKENKGFYFGLDDYKSRDFYSKTYVSYEEAELACLKKLIEIAKKDDK